MAAQNTSNPGSMLLACEFGALPHRCTASEFYPLSSGKTSKQVLMKSQGARVRVLMRRALQSCHFTLSRIARVGNQLGKKAGGWGTGYVALYTNPTIVDAAINYPHGPLQRRELYRGDGEEC